MEGGLSYVLRPRSHDLIFTSLWWHSIWKAVSSPRPWSKISSNACLDLRHPYWSGASFGPNHAWNGRIRCVGQDSNLGTPSGRDLESLAFDRAWLPTRGRAGTAVRKTFRVTDARGTHHPSLFPVGRLPGRQSKVDGAILHQGILRRDRESPQRGSGVGEEGRDDHGESRPHLYGSQCLVSR